jgi:hypothetical protein
LQGADCSETAFGPLFGTLRSPAKAYFGGACASASENSKRMGREAMRLEGLAPRTGSPSRGMCRNIVRDHRKARIMTVQFPRRESSLPIQDWSEPCVVHSGEAIPGCPTKIRESFCLENAWIWSISCIAIRTWTHSDRRLTQVLERGGRGLLQDECWSFPPASEREARMDDPTPRSRKRRSGNGMRLSGLLFPSKGPVLISGG